MDLGQSQKSAVSEDSDGWQSVEIPIRDSDFELDSGLPDELYVSCWHSNSSESAAMWSLYSGANGIAIKTTTDLLAEALRDSGKPIEIASVTYIDIVPNMVVGTPWSFKRLSFQHESEVRAAMRDPDCKDTGISISADSDLLIQEVYVSPESEAWVRDVVENVIAKYGLQKHVQQSDLWTPR